jgi:hypothetical protein
MQAGVSTDKGRKNIPAMNDMPHVSLTRGYRRNRHRDATNIIRTVYSRGSLPADKFCAARIHFLLYAICMMKNSHPVSENIYC